jgi:hypothetical protein
MTTSAIDALIKIMRDEKVPIRRRIEAASGLLDYEAPLEAVELAKEFLKSVFEDPAQHVDDKLDASKLMRKAEAAKISRPMARATNEGDCELSRNLEIAHRRLALMDAGVWPPPPGWIDDLLSKDYKPLHGSGGGTRTFVGMGDRLREARERLARKPRSLNRARNP